MISITTKGLFAEPRRFCTLPPELESMEFGAIFTYANIGDEYAPSMRTEDKIPSIKGIIDEPKPRMGSDELVPGLKVFPVPD
jgi:hypothetical protein